LFSEKTLKKDKKKKEINASKIFSPVGNLAKQAKKYCLLLMCEVQL